MASFVRFVAAVACLLAGGVVGALNPQQIALDLGFATLHTSLGLGVLVAILLGVVAGGLLVAVGVPDGDLDALHARLGDPLQRDAVRAWQAARWGDGDVQAALVALRQAFRRGPRLRAAGDHARPLLPPLYPE